MQVNLAAGVSAGRSPTVKSDLISYRRGTAESGLRPIPLPYGVKPVGTSPPALTRTLF